MSNKNLWLEKTRLRASSNSKTKISHEIKFSDDLHALFCVRFNPNGELIAASFANGEIQIRSGVTGELKSILKSGINTAFPVMCCQFNPIYQNIFYAASACGKIFKCSTDKNDLSIFAEEPKNEVNTVDINIGGEQLVSGGKDAVLRLYDTNEAKIICEYKKHVSDMKEEMIGKFHRMRIFAAKFHPIYPALIISGGWDDTVRIWDTREKIGCIRVIKGPHICGNAIDVKDNKILTGSWVVRGSLQLWDMTSGKLIETIVPQNRPTTLDGEFLYTVQYFRGDSYGDLILAGGSGIGALEIISLKNKKVIANFEVNKAIMTVDSLNSSIVFGGMESVIRIVNYQDQ